MYKTKKDLDSYVEDVFSRIRGDHEKNVKCFTIAKQYASIKEFNSALRYMEKYLTTGPANTGEALRLMGDFYLEICDFKRALEFYKSSYKARRTREALNKVCDLLEAGHGSKEDQLNWFEMQKVARSQSDAVPLPFYQDSKASGSTNRPTSSSGPPKTGFSKTLLDASTMSTSLLKSDTHAVNGASPHDVSFSRSLKVYFSPEREDNQIRNLERRYDDVLAKILGSVQRIEDNMKNLKAKVDTISVVQEGLIESRNVAKKAEANQSRTKNVKDGLGDGNIKNIPPVYTSQQIPPLFPQSPAFGYGVPFPNPYMQPYFMPDPTLSYVANPMLAAAALYGNPLFGSPLASVGGPRNEGVQAGSISNDTSLLAELLSKNQLPPQVATSSQAAELYAQTQLQAQIASSANLIDKLWQQPQLVPTSVALGPTFSNSEGTFSITPSRLPKTPESGNRGIFTSTPISEPTEDPESTKSSTTPTAKKDINGKHLFPENVVVSNTEKVPTVSSATFNSNVLSVTIPPEHRNAAPVFKPQEPKIDEKVSQDSAANPFSSISLTAPSFGDLAKSAAATGFTGFSGSSFGGSGAPVFGHVIASQSAAGEPVVRPDRVDGEEGVEDFVPTAEFQPAIPMPPLVEVKKGNENENTLFEHRAKLYRFVKESKEWKERGVGNIMILQDKDNPRKIRVVMWRERVYKLACNHWITKDLTIENHQGSPKILKWTVLDFAEVENDSKVEIFSCRFGQEDKCAAFKATIERMVKYLVSQGDPSPEKPSQEKEKNLSDMFKKPVGSWKTEKSLSELFKPPEGSWNCGSCLVVNIKEINNCCVCGTLKPGSQPDTVAVKFGFAAENVVSSTDTTENCSGCRGCDPDSFDFSKLDHSAMPTVPKDPIQKISKSLDVGQPTIFGVPKCTTVTESQLRDLLSPNTSMQKDKENESVSDANSTKTDDDTSKFRFTLGADSSATLNTGFQLKTPSFSFTPTFTPSSESTTASVFGGKLTTTPFVFGNTSIFGGNLSSTATSTPFTSEQRASQDVVVPSVVPQNSSVQLPKASQPFKFGFLDTPSKQAEDGNEEDNEDEEEDDEDEDDDDNEEPMFESDAQFAISETLDAYAQFDDLGEGQARIIYDGEQFCARLLFMKDDDCLIDHFIAAETTLQSIGELSFEWIGINVTEEHTMKIKMRITFPDQQAYDAFSSTMAESTELALKADVTEAFLMGEGDGSDDES